MSFMGGKRNICYTLQPGLKLPLNCGLPSIIPDVVPLIDGEQLGILPDSQNCFIKGSLNPISCG